ncbi:MAG: tetratricopeptide repeat protein [Nitrospinaceae bacterium]|nr:tetratricopeptide repeat protein [Nitrospinaceae bacterium]
MQKHITPWDLPMGALGKHLKKIKAFEEAIRIQPSFAGAHFKLGIAHAALERYQGAGESYKLALKIVPDYPLAHYFMALSYYLSNRYEETVPALKEAISMDQGPCRCPLSSGTHLSETGSLSRILIPLQKAFAINPELSQSAPATGFGLN